MFPFMEVEMLPRVQLNGLTMPFKTRKGHASLTIESLDDFPSPPKNKKKTRDSFCFFYQSEISPFIYKLKLRRLWTSDERSD